MTQNERLGVAILTGFVLAFLEPELINVAQSGIQLINESMRRPNLGGVVFGGVVSIAAISAAFYKHPKLLPEAR